MESTVLIRKVGGCGNLICEKASAVSSKGVQRTAHLLMGEVNREIKLSV